MHEKKILSFDSTSSLKGLAILFVILGHLQILPVIFADLGVGIFFILSGYGLTESYKKNGLKNFVKKKLLKVWVPYFLVTLLWIVIDTFLGDFPGIIPSILSLSGVNLYKAIDPTMWYITFLLLWYFGFFIVFKFELSLKKKLTLLFISGLILYFSLEFIIPDIDVIQHYSICFPIGVAFSVYFDKVNRFIINSVNKSLFVGFIFLVLALIIYFTGNKSLLFGVIMPGALFFILIIDYLNLYVIKTKILHFFGNYSYELYLFEGAFIWKYWNLFNIFSFQWLKILIYFILIYVLSYYYKSILKKSIYKM